MKFIKNTFKEIVRKIELERLGVACSDERLFANEMNNFLRQETFQFIRERMPTASYFQNWKEMFDYVVANMSEGLLLEFGVARGKSINYLADKTKRPIDGFDSFVGFPETYVGHVTSKFDFGGNIPKVRGNVTLHPGYFEKTLPSFVEAHAQENVAFIHIDCDIYSSTKTVFQLLQNQIHDTFVQFDELFNYWCWRVHEIKAFDEFLAENPRIHCDYIGFSHRQALVRA